MPEETTTQVYSEALKLLREGKVQDADNLLSQARAAAEPAAVAAPSSPPRTPPEILEDLAREVVLQLGSPPNLQRLIDELDRTRASIEQNPAVK